MQGRWAQLRDERVGVVVLLREHLVVLIDNRHREKNARSGANCACKISKDAEETNAHASKCSSGGDVAIQLVHEGVRSVALHDHLLVPQLLSDILRSGSRYFNPRLGKQGARRQDEDKIDHGVQRIGSHLGEGVRRRDVVRKTRDGHGLAGVFLHIAPHTKKTHENISAVSVEQELGTEVQVAHKRCLQNDRHVRGVKQLNRILAGLAAVFGVLDGQVHLPSLEINNNKENKDSREQVHQIREVLAVKCFLQSADLVRARQHQMDKCNQGTFEFRSTASVDRGWAEGLPDDGLANVGCDKKRNTRAKTISLLKQLVKDDDNEPSNEQLQYDQNSVARA